MNPLKAKMGVDFDLRKVNGFWEFVEVPKKQKEEPSKKIEELFKIIEDKEE